MNWQNDNVVGKMKCGEEMQALSTNWFPIYLGSNLAFNLSNISLMWCFTLLQCQICVYRKIQDMPSFLFPVTVKPWKEGYEIPNTASLLMHPLHPEPQWSFKFLTGLLTGRPAIPYEHGCGGRKKKKTLCTQMFADISVLLTLVTECCSQTRRAVSTLDGSLCGTAVWYKAMHL